MLSYDIRSATDSDMPFLWNMLYLSLHVPDGQQPFPRSVLDEPRIAHYLTQWGRTGDRAFIAAVERGDRIGAGWMRLFDESDQGYGYVSHDMPELAMAIVPEYRGKGVGGAMLERMMTEARKRGLRGISLSVDPGNQAVRLYRRHGFEQVGICDTSWTMVKLFD